MSAYDLAWLSNVLVRCWLHRTMQCSADPKLPAWTSRRVRACRKSFWKVESACCRSWKKQTKRCIRKFESQDYTGINRFLHLDSDALCVGSSICCGGECLCWEALVQKSRASCPHNGPWGLLCYAMLWYPWGIINIYSPKCYTCLIWYPQHVRQRSIPSPTNVWWWYGHGQTAPMSPWGEERRGSWSDQHLDRKEFAHLDSGFPLGSDGIWWDESAVSNE